MADVSNDRWPNRPRPKLLTQRKSAPHTLGFIIFFSKNSLFAYCCHVGNFEKDTSLKLGQCVQKESEYKVW